MTTARSTGSLLNLNTGQLTRALKRLCRVERNVAWFRLSYDSRLLTISAGKASEEIEADGAWAQPVFVRSIWATIFAATPVESAVTSLRQDGGWLYTRDHKMECSLEPCLADGGPSREVDVSAARRALAPYGVTEREVNALIDKADPGIAQIWGAGDGPLIDEIGAEWARLCVFGLDPSDIRSLIDRKSRRLWKDGRKGGSFFARYNIDESEEKVLIESGRPAKAACWSRNMDLRGPIGKAWRHLVLYGVEPSSILSLIEKKVHRTEAARDRSQ